MAATVGFVAAMLVTACLPTLARALPASAITVIEGRVTFTPTAGGGGKSTIRLRVRNEADAPLESIRVGMVFSRRPMAEVPADAKWRYRTVYFRKPLAPGG